MPTVDHGTGGYWDSLAHGGATSGVTGEDAPPPRVYGFRPPRQPPPARRYGFAAPPARPSRARRVEVDLPSEEEGWDDETPLY